MRIESEQPNVIKVNFRQEKCDADYSSCMWARFYFDLDTYTLTIESDCGNYVYGWAPTPKYESFIELMCRIETDYLLSKISSESVFDMNKSVEDTCENISDYCDYMDELSEILEEIKDIPNYAYGEYDFYQKASDICDRYGVADSFEIICVVKHYPAGAVKIADIFENIVEPYLKKNYIDNEGGDTNDYFYRRQISKGDDL